nr:aminodeoxychorismate lyase [Aliikangiella sp. G2MR2-5]
MSEADEQSASPARHLEDETPQSYIEIEEFAQNRGMLFGDGFFTTGIVKNGNIELLPSHCKRLNDSISRLKFDEFSIKSLIHFLEISTNAVALAGFRLTVARRQKERGYSISKNHSYDVLLQLFDLPLKKIDFCRLSFANTPVSLNPALAGIKHLNRLDNVLASSEIDCPEAEVIMCYGDQVFSGSKSNIFIKKDGVWKTPEINLAGVNGIMRQRVIEYFRAENIPFEETKLFKSDILSAKEAFVTNCIIGVWPASKIEDKKLDTKESCTIKSYFIK